MSDLEIGMRGGKKQLWNKEHKSEIIEYFAKNGEEATLIEFNMHKTTLQHLLQGDNRGRILNEKKDRAIILAEIANERILEVRRDLEEVKKHNLLFIDTVVDQLSEKLFKPLLRSKIELPAELEVKPNHDLDVDFLMQQGREADKGNKKKLGKRC